MIKSLIVPVADTLDRSYLEIALGLAQTHDAKLIGLYSGQPHDLPGYIIELMPQSVIEKQQHESVQAAEAAQAAFIERCNAASVRSEWRGPDRKTRRAGWKKGARLSRCSDNPLIHDCASLVNPRS